MTEAQQRLCCPVAGAVFVKKLAMKGQTQGADAEPKKRPRVPDLSDVAPKKAPKAKGKAKAKAKAASGKDAGSLLEKETPESLQADVEFALGNDGGQGLPAGSRQRLWLDDVLAALQRCQTGPFAAVASTKAAGQLVSMLLSFALEFCFTGSVRLQKTKPLKVWSQAPRFSRSVDLSVDQFEHTLIYCSRGATSTSEPLRGCTVARSGRVAPRINFRGNLGEARPRHCC